MKRVAFLTATLFGAMIALQPAVASAQDRYGYRYDDRGYHRNYDHDRDWREHERRERERWRDHERREWREHEWREHHPIYYGGTAYFYGGGPGYTYGFGYAPPPCR